MFSSVLIILLNNKRRVIPHQTNKMIEEGAVRVGRGSGRIEMAKRPLARRSTVHLSGGYTDLEVNTF